MAYYRRRYSRRRRRTLDPELVAEEARREIYWQVRREISPQFSKLKLGFFDHVIYAAISAVFSIPVIAFLFWFAFSLRTYHVRPGSEVPHSIVVLAILGAAIYFPGSRINQFLWPKFLKIAGYIVVAIAFYFGLKAQTNIFTRARISCAPGCVSSYTSSLNVSGMKALNTKIRRCLPVA